jgi:hypothetical protein
VINFSTREVQTDGQSVVLRYRSVVGFVVVASAILGLVIARYVIGNFPAAPTIWPILVGFWTVGTLLNVGWLFWGMTVVFDRGRDRFWRGPFTVGRVSTIAAVERRDDPRAALQLVLREGRGEERRWPVPGMNSNEAEALGLQLARGLGVPFR